MEIIIPQFISFSMSLLALTQIFYLYPKFAFSTLLINGTNPACRYYSPSTCSQTCDVSAVCSTFSCRAPNGCNQTAYNASYVPEVLCASEECMQKMNYTNVDKMHAAALRVSQVKLLLIACRICYIMYSGFLRT